MIFLLFHRESVEVKDFVYLVAVFSLVGDFLSGRIIDTD